MLSTLQRILTFSFVIYSFRGVQLSSSCLLHSAVLFSILAYIVQFSSMFKTIFQLLCLPSSTPWSCSLLQPSLSSVSSTTMTSPAYHNNCIYLWVPVYSVWSPLPISHCHAVIPVSSELYFAICDIIVSIFSLLVDPWPPSKSSLRKNLRTMRLEISKPHSFSKTQAWLCDFTGL